MELIETLNRLHAHHCYSLRWLSMVLKIRCPELGTYDLFFLLRSNIFPFFLRPWFETGAIIGFIIDDW